MSTTASGDGAYTCLTDLARLQYDARGFSYLPGQPVQSQLSGRKRSRLRGRGLDFDELRHYRPGDDIRTMDWRVTNRTGKPHVRVYTEERDRPVLAVVDQRLPMFFGSRVRMKSVAAAEMAALTAWRVLDVGDRIGAILFNDDRQVEIPPARSQRKLMAWLGELVNMNGELSAGSDRESNSAGLTAALQLALRRVSHDHLVVIISDFYGWNDEAVRCIKRIAQHNDVICALIHDPLERNISNASNLVVSNGRYQFQIDPDEHDLGEKFEASFQDSFSNVRTQLQRLQIPILLIDTEETVSSQLRKALGGRRGIV